MPYDIPLDFSSLRYLACDRWYQFTIVFGLARPDAEEDKARAYGNLIHRFAEHWGKWDPTSWKAMGVPDQDLTTVQLLACRETIEDQELKPYYESTISQFQFRLPQYGELARNANGPAAELKFAHRIEHSSSYSLVLCGTIDRLEMPRPGREAAVIRDFKTTAYYTDVDESTLTFQLPFYLYVTDRFIRPDFPDLPAKLHAEITQVRWASLPTLITDSSPITEPPDTEELLTAAANKAIAIWELGTTIAHPVGSMLGMCYKCQFKAICATRSQDAINNFIRNHPKKAYNPMEHR